MNKKLHLLVFLIILILSSVGMLSAQSTTASISGTVLDEQQAVVPNATVTVRNVETGFTRTTQTNGEGGYNFVNLPIGAYEVTAEAANFSKYVQTGITLDVNQNAVVDVPLKASGGAALFRGLAPGERVGNAGRNILRSDGIKLVDFGIIKNTRITETVRFQLRADIFNSLNERNYGIPNSVITSGANFLNEGATNGGNRRIILGARLVF
ncbi:hypothetical protein BH24ACI2_BH24ACI2_12560 [soil metagenome]|nr:carboxypeptidase regulatory-like domain-containing protein [Acidobacteriota bacterium]